MRSRRHFVDFTGGSIAMDLDIEINRFKQPNTDAQSIYPGKATFRWNMSNQVLCLCIWWPVDAVRVYQTVIIELKMTRNHESFKSLNIPLFLRVKLDISNSS
jgi:hypothetical protein